MLYECVQLIISLKKMIEKLKMIIPSDFENNFSTWNSVNIFFENYNYYGYVKFLRKTTQLSGQSVGKRLIFRKITMNRFVKM